MNNYVLIIAISVTHSEDMTEAAIDLAYLDIMQSSNMYVQFQE